MNQLHIVDHAVPKKKPLSEMEIELRIIKSQQRRKSFMEEFRMAGLNIPQDIRFIHLRKYHSFFHTTGFTDNVRDEMLAVQTLSQVNIRGGATIAYQIVEEAIHSAIAITNSHENYSKKDGRQIATFRLLKSVDNFCLHFSADEFNEMNQLEMSREMAQRFIYTSGDTDTESKKIFESLQNVFVYKPTEYRFQFVRDLLVVLYKRKFPFIAEYR